MRTARTPSGRVRSPSGSSPTMVCAAGPGSRSTGRSRRTADSARAPSSAWPWPGRWRSCTGSGRTCRRWRARWTAGRRSAIGTWTFALGGFIVEGGRRAGGGGIAPLLARFTLPKDWRCVVAVPDGAPGLSGEAEAAAFDAASAAGGAGGGARRPSGADAAAARPGRERPGRLRERAHRDPAHHRGLVRAASRAVSSHRGPRRRWCGGWRRGGRRAWVRAPGARRCTASSGARRPRASWRGRPRRRWGRPGGFSRGALRTLEPESGGGKPPDCVIDSSFCTMYTGPSKPPARDDLAIILKVRCGQRIEPGPRARPLRWEHEVSSGGTRD